MPKTIQVLLSSYNGEKYIEVQIRSIMDQKCEADVLLTLRDDGSTDGTVDVVKQLQQEYQGRIDLIEAENIGSNAGFFSLIKNAPKADYYALSDQDDIWLPDKLQVAIGMLQKEDDSVPLLFSCTSYVVGDDLIPHGQTRKQERPFTLYNTVVQNICPGHNQVFNNALRDLLMDVDASRVYVYDYWIMNTAMLYGRILFTNESYTLYRQHSGNQFGSGKTKAGKLITSVKHASAGDGEKRKEQIAYFAEANAEALAQAGLLSEVERLVSADGPAKRIACAISSKFFRQSKMETLAYRLGIIMGSF